MALNYCILSLEIILAFLDLSGIILVSLIEIKNWHLMIKGWLFPKVSSGPFK